MPSTTSTSRPWPPSCWSRRRCSLGGLADVPIAPHRDNRGTEPSAALQEGGERLDRGGGRLTEGGQPQTGFERGQERVVVGQRAHPHVVTRPWARGDEGDAPAGGSGHPLGLVPGHEQHAVGAERAD